MNALNFIELTIKNFMSFGQNRTVIDLSEPGAIEVIGQNLDKNGTSNGSGKTTIINAICYILYNKPFDNIALNQLINSTNSSKNTEMEVSLTFKIGENQYYVARTRGASTSITIQKNGTDITPGKSVNECDALIQDLIGVSYELFVKIIVFSGNSQAFLQLPLAAQRTQIEELFNITILSEKAEVLKELIKNKESDIKVQDAIIKQEIANSENHKKRIQDAQKRVQDWENSKVQDIKDINDALTKIQSIDFDAEKELHEKVQALKSKMNSASLKKEPIQKDVLHLSSTVKKLLSEQEHLKDSKCPYCSQNFADSKKKLQEIESNIGINSDKLSTSQNELSELSQELEHAQKEYTEVNSKIKHKNFNELLEIKENEAVLKNSLKNIQDSENPYIEPLNSLLSEVQKDVSSEASDMMKKELHHMTFLLKLLTHKDSFLRRRIIDKSVPFLNSRINFYTCKLGLPHTVKFNSDMTCVVSEFGRELSFGNLSAGEKKRVNIGLALAFRDVLHHLHVRSNILLVDELDGQLDASGIDDVIRIIKDKCRDDNLTAFVISHHPNVVGRLDRQLIIQKKHGFSTILS